MTMRRRVLIAEPDALLLAAYQAFLAAEGVQTVAVTNGVDCRAALRQCPPDVLVLDSDLALGPDGEGLDLLREAREASAVPVLILTSHPEDLTRGGVPLGDYGLLIKPVPPATVAGVIRSLGEPA
jgi:two-component system response regulator MtrA